MMIIKDVSYHQFENAIKAINNNGGNTCMQRDDSIKFRIKGVIGFATLTPSELTIEITDKPFLASYSMIESEIRKFFKG